MSHMMHWSGGHKFCSNSVYNWQCESLGGTLGLAESKNNFATWHHIYPPLLLQMFILQHSVQCLSNLKPLIWQTWHHWSSSNMMSDISGFSGSLWVDVASQMWGLLTLSKAALVAIMISFAAAAYFFPNPAFFFHFWHIPGQGKPKLL